VPRSDDEQKLAEVGTDTDPLSETTRIPLRGFLRQAAAGQTKPRLVVIEGGSVGSMVDIGDSPVIIGREIDVGMTVAEVGVSRRHAKVFIEGEAVFIEDMGSKNGTYVNREPIDSGSRQKLEDGDIIFIGAATIKFLAAGNVELSFLQHLHEVSALDPLTRVANRRSFEEYLKRELPLATMRDRDLVLLVVDVDHFKAVNDTHGHLAGDTVLKDLAGLMQQNLRGSDFLCRYGGEEFAIVLPATNLTASLPLAERLRFAVSQHDFVHEGTHIPVTISIGAAGWTEAGISNKDELIACADNRLYKAKEAGRNRVIGHD